MEKGRMMKHGSFESGVGTGEVEPGRVDDGNACQHGVHTKAFTGKGVESRRIRQAKDDVDKVHQRQRELSIVTRNLEGRMFYLALHVRNATGQLSVRWRQAGSARNTHLSWGEMEGLFQHLPLALANWYRTADQMARTLNQEEQLARDALRRAQEAIDQNLVKQGST